MPIALSRALPSHLAARRGASLLMPLAAALIVASASLGSIRAQEKTLDFRRVIGAPGSYVESLPQDQWIPETTKFSRLREGADRVTVLDAKKGGEKGGEKPLFTAREFNAALAAAGMKVRNAGRIGASFTWRSTSVIRVETGGAVYYWQIGTPKAQRAFPLPKNAERVAITADDSRLAFVRNHQLFVQTLDLLGNPTEPKQVAKDGSVDIVYGGAAHRQEFGITDGLWWSPTASHLAFFREDLRPITEYPYVDHTAMPPKALHGRYPMAGGKNSFVQIGIYDVATGELKYLDHGGEKDVYWTNATFAPDGKTLDVAIVNRAQNHMKLVRFDVKTGRVQKVLFEEKDEKWIEPEHGPIFLPDGGGRFLWFSPRDGHRHLYLYDGSGKLVSQVTKGAFDVQEFRGFAGAHAAFVMASGENPLEMHLWRVELPVNEKARSMTRVTKDRGRHECTPCPGAPFVLDTFSNLENPGQSQVVHVGTGETSFVTKAAHRLPVRGKQSFFHVKAEDGTKLHGTIILPPGLDPRGRKKYPVLLYVYGGPHSQLVQDRWLGGSRMWLHYMATRGFIVCTLDNRGTDNRGIAFAQSIFRRLSELEVKDQLRAVDHLKKLPFVDAKRIGVHGWSYGGYMTLNLMLKSPRGTFACGASGAPVTDWKQYETGYTERYMDTPKENPKGFAGASVLASAKNLTGRLLLIHGTDDRTVMWSQSLTFVDRCIDAGVLLDYMPYPMQKHGIRGRDRVHLYALLTRFFVEHLRPGR